MLGALITLLISILLGYYFDDKLKLKNQAFFWALGLVTGFVASYFFFVWIS